MTGINDAVPVGQNKRIIADAVDLILDDSLHRCEQLAAGAGIPDPEPGPDRARRIAAGVFLQYQFHPARRHGRALSLSTGESSKNGLTGVVRRRPVADRATAAEPMHEIAVTGSITRFPARS